MPKTPTLKQRSLPQHGVISGGVLDGWSYGLDEVRIEKNAVVVDVLATPPKWPFPTLVALRQKDFDKLRNPGAIAKENDTQTLIDAAIERARTGQQK
jgi:hypothetical protein